MNYSKKKAFSLIFFMLFITSCNNGDPMHNIPSYKDLLDPVAENTWNKLSQKRIYFGHQSVGFNIIDGITDLMTEYSNLNLKIKETYAPDDFNGPLFAHSRVGQNRDWQSKIDDFQKKMKSGIGNKADIAFFKFCYVDITRDTDINQVFESYKKTMNNLQKQFPKTVFLHTTTPLKSVTATWKIHLKRILGKNKEYLDNINRNKYNKLIRDEYGNSGKLFDIALAESLYQDGSQENFRFKGKEYTALIPSFTYDGGHLNENGRRVAAAYLLTSLATINN